MIAGLGIPYMDVAQEWIQHAYRPATRRHHAYILRLYTGLAEMLGLDHMRPTEEMAISFTTFLAYNFKTQKSVRSMVATLIACLQRAGIDASKFSSTNASMVSRSISINKRAPTRQRPPVDTHVLHRIITHWRRNEAQGPMLAAGALLMFSTSVRQSNVFPPNQHAFDHTRQLTYEDVTWRSQYLKINIKWGKAQQKTCTKFQKILRASSFDMCVYSALRAIPRPTPPNRKMPLICFADGKPVPVSYVVKKWKEALKSLSLDDMGFTLHSLRRGGARYLHDQGVEVGNIARHAGWRSNAINDYVDAPGTRQAYSAWHALA